MGWPGGIVAGTGTGDWLVYGMIWVSVVSKKEEKDQKGGEGGDGGQGAEEKGVTVREPVCVSSV